MNIQGSSETTRNTTLRDDTSQSADNGVSALPPADAAHYLGSPAIWNALSSRLSFADRVNTASANRALHSNPLLQSDLRQSAHVQQLRRAAVAFSAKHINDCGYDLNDFSGPCKLIRWMIRPKSSNIDQARAFEAQANALPEIESRIAALQMIAGVIVAIPNQERLPMLERIFQSMREMPTTPVIAHDREKRVFQALMDHAPSHHYEQMDVLQRACDTVDALPADAQAHAINELYERAPRSRGPLFFISRRAEASERVPLDDFCQIVKRKNESLPRHLRAAIPAYDRGNIPIFEAYSI